MANYQRKDTFYSKAKSEGYRSRAAFKLIELQKRLKLIKRGDVVVDLGCWPGGWLQVSASLVGSPGCVVGVDLDEVIPFQKHEFKLASTDFVAPELIVGDVTQNSTITEIMQATKGPVDLVLSDMSPKLSGIKLRDVAITVELVETAFLSCSKMLKNGGSFVCKTFPSAELDEIFKQRKVWFERLTRVALDSSRKTSKEYYLIGRNFNRQAALSSLNEEDLFTSTNFKPSSPIWDPFQ